MRRLLSLYLVLCEQLLMQPGYQSAAGRSLGSPTVSSKDGA